MKTHGGWQLELSPDGLCTWTPPTGRVYVRHAHNQGNLVTHGLAMNEGECHG